MSLSRRQLITGSVAAAAAPLHRAEAASWDLLHVDAPQTMPVFRVEGVRRLVHELACTNFSDQSLRLEALSVTTDGGGTEIARWEGAALASRMMKLPWQDDAAPTQTMGRGERVALFVEAALASEARQVGHTFVLMDAQGRTREVSTSSASIIASPADYEAPLRGGPWVAIYNYQWERGHRRVYSAPAGRAVIPGRFAIDFVGVDEGGRTRPDNARVVAEFFGFGAAVYAISDGRVVHARGDMPDNAMGADAPDMRPQDLSGNTVVIDMGRGRFVHYQHLAQTSVRVRVGDRVRSGQVLGALGNSGESFEPHLHLHIADRADALAGDGLPLGFRRFELLGRYDAPEAIGASRWTARNAPLAPWRTQERPAEMAVVSF